MRIPLYIEMAGKNVLIIGGGEVGTSRAKKFLDAGANVRVLSLEFIPEIKELEKNNPRLKLIEEDANTFNLEPLFEWAHFVTIAVGDLKLNEVAKNLAAKKKCLLNLANDSSQTEVVVPFDGEYEGIRFAVTTEGKSGVVARMIRDSILEMLKKDDEKIYLLRAMEYLKKYMKAEKVPIDLRMSLYFEISSDKEFRSLVRDGNVEEAKSLAEKLVQEYVSGKRVPKSKSLTF
ncbi:bifunctional precorrin-2 dehydrogenase/sirohydrochlorin ferrochelatase [Archaeoglobales archaeon]|nr:MAG: bifunctional precorrin-2 dehydrogenase/sirohydrochlorin ferrochelatase [Archaeoglobales archaeon]